MRHVLLAVAGLVAAIAWINNSSEGAKIKREWTHSAARPPSRGD